MKKLLFTLLGIILLKGNTYALLPQVVSDNITDNIIIKEVVIEGKRVIQYPDKDVWIITKEMRKNAFDTQEMLGNIPGMYYNPFTKELNYHGQKNIKILMDSKEKPNGYIANLAHLRFKHVEITPNPQGLYRDYDVLINLITKDNYEGIEGLVDASSNYKPEQSNPISMIAPGLTFSYTRSKKINLALHYDYLYNSQQSNFMSIERWYPDYSLKTFRNSGPVEFSKSMAHNTWFDGDYDLNQNHSISFRYTYNKRDPRTRNDFLVEKDYTDSVKNNTLRRELTLSTNHEKEHIATLYYRGHVNDWNLYGDFNYNYLTGENDYRFEEEEGQQLYSKYHNQKHYTRLALDASRVIKDKTSVNIGYINTYRLYKSDNEFSQSSSDEYRNQLYASLSQTFSRKLNGGISGYMEMIRNKYLGKTTDQWLWSAATNLRYRLKRPGSSIGLSYNMRPTYPNQSQLNPIGFRTGYGVWVVGNPNLKSNLTHSLRITVSPGKFSLWGGMQYANNKIMNLVTQDPTNGIVQSYYNIRYLNPSFGGSFMYSKIWNNFMYLHLQIGASYNFIQYRLDSKGIDTQSGKFKGNVNLHLNLIGIQGAPSLMIAYEDNGYGYEKSPQGRFKDEQKSIQVSANTSFFNSKLQVSLDYQLPLKGNDYHIYHVEQSTPYYRTSVQRNLFESEHSLKLTARWRFAYGHQIRKKNNNQTIELEDNSLLH